MADILLLGATGYTGRLTARVLAQRGASFALAGRSRARLEDLAARCGNPPLHVVRADDGRALTKALEGRGVLLTCLGPFEDLGETAAEAALRARVHYADSCGEAEFVRSLVERRAESARRSAVAMAPAMAFEEVVADLAATLACRGLGRTDLTLTYAVPPHASRGTVRSLLRGVVHPARFIDAGVRVEVRTGRRRRWAPLPPPLGPRLGIAAPLPELELAPLHLPVRSLSTYVSAGGLSRLALRAGVPALGRLRRAPAAWRLVEETAIRAVPRPNERTGATARWTVLAEARAAEGWRNVAVSGPDVYRLSAEMLASAAIAMGRDGFDATGVLAPVQALGVAALAKDLEARGASIQTYEAA